MITYILRVGHHLLTGIKINGSTGELTYGRIKNGTGSTNHWVVITGISNRWEDENEETASHSSNWIRIFNPFDNETEYYWWGDFRPSWRASHVGLDAQYLELWPKSSSPLIKPILNPTCKSLPF